VFLIKVEHISITTADNVQEEYQSVCADGDIRKQLTQFSITSTSRLDELYARLLNGNSVFDKLWNFINASVEDGLLVNES
jgi:hypothetical protein